MTHNIAQLDYPVQETFPALKQALHSQQRALLEAPPGAGKTTLVPLALLDEPWLAGQKIIMLEPRRLAARMAAKRMADLLGEKVGQTVGYRIRQDKNIGRNTRIEVVTEGILTRQLQSDPELNGVGLVIFDEFHERNLQGDLGLAFCMETQDALRDDLRLLVMSATLDGGNLASFLGNAARITSEGRAFDVAVDNLPRPDKFSLVNDTVRTISKAIMDESGSLLVFLPGEGEIRKAQSLLNERYANDPHILVAPLYGALPPQEQDKAITPPPKGVRKIVLATTIAETSLTIEDIRIVIDCGYKRVARFDNARSMSRLETVRVSQAAATQRKGRAGRMQDGICYQLWPQAETHALAERDTPEILESDLTPLALELSAWGVHVPEDLKLLDYPPKNAFQQAQDLLFQLGGLDKNATITAHGKEMLALSLHPRLAHMILTSSHTNENDAALACDIAATLQDGPLLKGARDCDLRTSLAILHNQAGSTQNIAKGALHRARQTAKNLKKRLKISDTPPTSYLETGRILALAYPDRIAKQRTNGQSSYHLSAGMGASLPDHDALSIEPFLVIAHMDGANAQARIFSAAPLHIQDIENNFPDLIQEKTETGWDKRTQSVSAARVRKFGALTLKSTPLRHIDPEEQARGLCYGIRQLGLHVLPWTKDSDFLCKRVEFLRKRDDKWPDMSEAGLLNTLEDWLLPYLNGINRIEQLKKIDLDAALLSRLDWQAQQELAKRAPTHYRVPSGSQIRLDYTNPEKPILSVKLQEMFGEPQTPCIDNATISLQIHLLSPAGRPLQVTEDLESFWQNGYDSVKKEMKGRYQKHPWPDNPIEAQATGKIKRKLA